ncbi:hypothetical protein [Streptomyces fructofermentans]|uniref:hypothetical protein n=1 Tax=Streptomyces fructofermentans TaxID=152141 RepID=UPI0037B70DB3
MNSSTDPHLTVERRRVPSGARDRQSRAEPFVGPVAEPGAEGVVRSRTREREREREKRVRVRERRVRVDRECRPEPYEPPSGRGHPAARG